MFAFLSVQDLWRGSHPAETSEHLEGVLLWLCWAPSNRVTESRQPGGSGWLSPLWLSHCHDLVEPRASEQLLLLLTHEAHRVDRVT